jgi:Flp pilus assembly protein TadG
MVLTKIMHSARASAGRRLLESEDGMALIHVAIALLVLMALSSFVLDYGVIWLSRGQAQAAADAGALAGATAPPIPAR